MRCGATADATFRHELRHDLESVLYVLLFLTIFCQGACALTYPNNRVPIDLNSDPVVDDWFIAESTIRRADLISKHQHKSGDVARFREQLLPRVNAYWADFLPFLTQLFELAFVRDKSNGQVHVNSPNQLTIQGMIGILDEAHTKVFDATDTIPAYPFNPDKVKRSREDDADDAGPPLKKK